MYHPSDPRSGLTTNPGTPGASATSEYGMPKLVVLQDTEPSFTSPGESRVWYVRTSAFVVAYYELVPRDPVALLPATADRIVIVPHDEEPVTLELGSASWVTDESSMFVAAGPGAVTTRTRATVIEVASYTDLSTFPHAVNEQDYATPMPRVAAPARRRVPGLQVGVKTYPMSSYPPIPGRFGRIIASSNIMANLLETEHAPRDTTRLSPHDHADFEQCCITTRGSYVHHWRTPWTPDLQNWREDMHVEYDSPAIAVIPPGVVHTANSISDGPNQMIDLFSPPRRDFAEKGWVLNSLDGEL